MCPIQESGLKGSKVRFLVLKRDTPTPHLSYLSYRLKFLLDENEILSGDDHHNHNINKVGLITRICTYMRGSSRSALRRMKCTRRLKSSSESHNHFLFICVHPDHLKHIFCHPDAAIKGKHGTVHHQKICQALPNAVYLDS